MYMPVYMYVSRGRKRLPELIKHRSHTVDFRRLEHGRKTNYADFPSFLGVGVEG